MPTLQRTFTVDASLEAVAAFHSDTNVLKRLTPPPVIIQIHKFEPLAEGSIARFTLWFGPFPIRWTAVHINVAMPDSFTDVQEKGPLKSWAHQHTFTAQSENLTLITDSIEYQHHKGLRGLVTRLLLGKPALKGMFIYRKLVTRRLVKTTHASQQSKT